MNIQFINVKKYLKHQKNYYYYTISIIRNNSILKKNINRVKVKSICIT